MPVTLEDIQKERARRQGGVTLEAVQAERARRQASVSQPAAPQAQALPRGAGIPEMVIQQPTRTPLTELTGGAINRGTFSAAGGTLGSVLGSPAGPVGALAGGGLGAAAGSSAFDVANRAIRAFQGRPQPNVSVPEEAARALQEGVTDVGFGAGAASLGPIVKSFKPLLGKLLGVSGEPTKQAIQEAARQGVPLAAAQVSKKPSVKGFSQVLGVFPYVGKPFKQLAARTGDAIDNRTVAILNELAPTATAADLGVDLTKAAKAKFKDKSRVGGALYKDFMDKTIAAGNPSIVPTDSTTQVASNFRELMKQERIAPVAAPQFQGSTGRLKAVKPSGQQDILKTPASLKNPLDQFFLDFAELPPSLTVLQTRGLQRSLNDAVERASAQGFDISRASQLKQAIEQDLNNLDVSQLAPEIGQPIVKALQDANGFWAREMATFETPTARRFGRVDRNIFSPRFATAGMTNPDEAFKAVVNSRSPQAMADLRKLVGGKMMKGVARRNVEDAFAKAQAAGSTKGSSLSFDPENLSKNLGLDSADGRRVLAESLKDTGISVNELERFVDVARTASDFAVPDVSTFLQRRLTLGGVRSLLATGVAGVAATQAPVTAVALGLLARKGSQILSSPSQLKSMTRALDDTVSDQVRRQAVMRLARAVLPDDETPEVPF